MLPMDVVQQCFGLSDEGVEDAIYDRQAIRRFIGIDLKREAAPDATTLLKFRRLLETHPDPDHLFYPRTWQRRWHGTHKPSSP
jgi:IS5 family transposase